MLERIEEIRAEAAAAIEAAPARAELEELRVRYLGRKAELTTILRGIAELPGGGAGQGRGAANRARKELEALLEARRAARRQRAGGAARRPTAIDVTLPGAPPRPVGHPHLIARTTRLIEDMMVGLGYRVAEGPEIEHDYYNFTALNHPPGHPARMLQDTFYVPVAPRGAAAHPHLADAGAGDGDAGAADLRRRPRQGLPARLRRHPQPDVPPDRGAGDRRGDHPRRPAGDAAGAVRGRSSAPSARCACGPHFFPFTEPSVEVDVSCFQCGGTGALADGERCNLCKGRAGSRSSAPAWSTPTCSASSSEHGYDPERVQGFAFGIGVERVAMLRHGVPDLRRFFDNDVRMLEQFAMRVPYSLAARVLRSRRSAPRSSPSAW